MFVEAEELTLANSNVSITLETLGFCSLTEHLDECRGRSHILDMNQFYFH